MGFLKPKKLLTAALLIISLTTAGIIKTPDTSAQTPGTAKKEAAMPDPDYLIGPEDILDVSVWRSPELSKAVNVRPDGKISLPLIGDVQAAGRTPNQLRDAITEKLKEYQQTVVVSVIVQEVNSYKIFINGEVSKPGTYTLRRKTTLLQAIALAGGFNQFASKNKIMVIRDRANGNGKEEKVRVRFDDIVGSDENSEKNIILLPGDTIFVP